MSDEVKALLTAAAFNSLFEMRGRYITPSRLLQMVLSILYLRCRQGGGAVAAAADEAFNSLFEMPRPRGACGRCGSRRLSILYLRCTPSVGNRTSTAPSSFNSLFEMLVVVGATNAGLITLDFQFSI